MKRLLKSAAILSALSTIAIAPIVLGAGAASAQGLETWTGKQGMTGNYLGAGVGASFHDIEDAEAGEIVNGSVQGRIAIPESPVSVRGAAFLNSEAAAFLPMVSLDVPVSDNANVYGGVGYSVLSKEGKTTALGDQNAVVLAAGAEAEFQDNLVLFGDAKVGLDAYEDSNDPALSLQLGLGYRF